MYEDRNIGRLIEKQKISGLRNSPCLHLLVMLTVRHSITVVQHVTSGSQSITSRLTEYHRRVTEIFFQNIFIFTKIYKSGSSYPFYYWWVYIFIFFYYQYVTLAQQKTFSVWGIYGKNMTYIVNIRVGESRSLLLA
jgi:hypothetical protein